MTRARGDQHSGLGISLEELLRQKQPTPFEPSTTSLAQDFFAKGVDLLKAGQPFEALPALFACLALDPGCVKAGNNLAVAFLKLGCVELARRLTEGVLVIDPGNERARAHLEFMTDLGEDEEE